jgi:hypothetical protein
MIKYSLHKKDISDTSIYVLLNNAVSSSDHIELNDRTLEKNKEASSHGRI